MQPPDMHTAEGRITWQEAHYLSSGDLFQVLINPETSQKSVTISWLKEQNRITSYHRGSNHGNRSNKYIHCAMDILRCNLIYTVPYSCRYIASFVDFFKKKENWIRGRKQLLF